MANIAYQYAQELLQTFSTSLGEVALIPVTGGIFDVTITHSTPPASSLPEENNPNASVIETLLWDRKTEGGFPETKELKNRVRNVIEPGRDLGHIDRSLKKQQQQHQAEQNDKKNQVDEKEQQPVDAGAESRAEPDPKKDGGAVTAPGADAGGKVDSKTDCEDCK